MLEMDDADNADRVAIRMRISRWYRWVDSLAVRGFIQHRALERLGILVGDDFQEGKPKRFLVALVDRANVDIQAGSADRQLLRLSRAARRLRRDIRRAAWAPCQRAACHWVTH